MKRFFVALYLVVYVVSLGFDVFGFDPKTDYLWDVFLEVALHFVAIIFMLFYIFNFKQKSWMLRCRLFPVALIIFDIISATIGMLGDSNKAVEHNVLVGLLLIPMIVPSWYLSYRLTYFASQPETNKNSLTQKNTFNNNQLQSEINYSKLSTALSFIFGALLGGAVKTTSGDNLYINIFVIGLTCVYLITFYFISKVKKFTFFPKKYYSHIGKRIIVGQHVALFALVFIIFIL